MNTSTKSEAENMQELYDLKLKKDALEKELAKYRQLVDDLRLTQYSIDNIADSIFWIDKSARIHFVNDAACRNLGYSKEELLSMTTFDVDPVFPKEKWNENWMEISEKGSSVVETIHRTKDGKEYFVEVTTNLVEFKGVKYNCAIARNITKRILTEELLKESEARFKVLHDASFGGIMIHDKGVILECNNGLSEMTGYSIDELIGMDGFKFVTDESKEIIMNKILTNSEKPYEAIGLRKNGEEFPILLEARSIPYRGKLVRSVELRDITQSKQAEEKLRKISAIHSKMVANLGDVIVIIDKDGINKYKSPNIENLFGWKSEELIGKSTWDNIHPEDMEATQKFINSLKVRPNKIGNTEMRYKCKDGSYTWIEFTGVNLLHDGDINGILGNYHDISERKLIEQSLKESETRFKALHNASFGGITIHDKGVILECNHGLSEITGYTVSELIGMNGLQLIAESSRDFVMDKILSGYEKPYESIGLRKNGEEYPIRLEARTVPYKGKMVRTVEFRDITDQKKSEQALRESEQKFKDLANFLPQTIFETDNKMNIKFINREATNAFGYSEDDIKAGLNAIEVIIPEDRDRIIENFKKVLNTNDSSSNEYVGLRKDGSTFPMIVSSSLIMKDNVPIGARGIIVDITQRKEAEEELKKQNQLLEAQYEEHMKLNEVLRNTNYDLEIAKKEAEESSKAKSIFLANMSHELRTPLVGILGYSDLLMSLIEDEELNEMASGVNRTGKRLLDTISLILDLSKIESDNYETNLGEHDPILLLKELFDGLKGGALTKNLKYSFLPHIDKYCLETDPEMFRIIFENILGNAIKFTSSGSVTISTNVEKNKDKNFFNVEISDTGIGINEDDIPQVFEEFKQLSEGTTKNFPGSGLGLSITKKFVELLNGSIKIKSKKGFGTSVVVKLPIM